MDTRQQIVAQTMEWLGTPYCHQASVKGVGTDCLGLLRGVWRASFGPEPQSIPSYSQDWSEPQHEEVLFKAACKYLTEKPVAQVQPADVLLFRMRTGHVAKHGHGAGLAVCACLFWTRCGQKHAERPLEKTRGLLF